PLYMSPEQCMGYTLDARSDIYSLGCVMFETLSGSNPFVADNAMQVIMKHVQGDVPAFKSSDHVSAAMKYVMLNCLEKDVNRRPKSAKVLRTNLELAREGKQPSPLSMLRSVRKKHLTTADNLIIFSAIVYMLCKHGYQIWARITKPNTLKIAG